jgi:hypothetical protein
MTPKNVNARGGENEAATRQNEPSAGGGLAVAPIDTNRYTLLPRRTFTLARGWIDLRQPSSTGVAIVR